MTTLTLLDKIKLIVSSVGIMPDMILTLMCERFIQELEADVKSGNTDKVPDEVWDFFKTVPKEVQVFFLTSFAIGLVDSCKAKQNASPDLQKEIEDMAKAVKEKQKQFEAAKETTKPEEPKIDGVDEFIEKMKFVSPKS